MATYEYHCIDCRHQFTEQHAIKEHDKQQPRCPKCNSRRVSQLLSGFHAITSRKAFGPLGRSSHR